MSVLSACRRTTLLPHENETPETLWSKVAVPDPRFWSTTGVYNVPLNITWMGGTMYLVSFVGILKSARNLL